MDENGEQQDGTEQDAGQQQGQQEGTTEKPQQPQDAQDVSALPEWAQKLIRDGRQEAATNRVKGKESGKAEVLATLAQALGLKGDDKPDPAKLAEDLKSKDGALREAKAELAVYGAASAVKADPQAILDSRSTMAKLAKLDPSDEDYNDEVKRIIGEAVKANPRLGAGTPVGSSARDMSSGGSGGRTLDDKARDGDVSPEEIRKLARESRKRF